MATPLYVLFESAAGFALFSVEEFDELAQDDEAMAAALADKKMVSKTVQLVAFEPFVDAETAAECIRCVSENEVSPLLATFLEANIASGAGKKLAKKGKFRLGVADPELGKAIQEHEALAGIKPVYNTQVRELLRACREHFPRLVKAVSEVDLSKAQLGLGHTFSRNKLQLDPNRQDKPIINTIALLDSLDKNINTFAMRVKEWYAWHFPELTKIVTNNINYAKVAQLIGIREQYEVEEQHDALVEACGADEVADEVEAALKTSMGQDLGELDKVTINKFADQVVRLRQLRDALSEYLQRKLDVVAPNLSALVGDLVSARLISHAGSLTNLAKYPASTVQILGAEKALFRALKTKGNTPKYGLIYHSSFITKASAKNKGRVSRYLANKCSLACRIDCFADFHTSVFGEKLRGQVEERLRFLSDGTRPRKNIEVMAEAVAEVRAAMKAAEKSEKGKKRSKKVVEESDEEEEAPRKKKKARKAADSDDEE